LDREETLQAKLIASQHLNKNMAEYEKKLKDQMAQREEKIKEHCQSKIEEIKAKANDSRMAHFSVIEADEMLLRENTALILDYVTREAEALTQAIKQEWESSNPELYLTAMTLLEENLKIAKSRKTTEAFIDSQKEVMKKIKLEIIFDKKRMPEYKVRINELVSSELAPILSSVKSEDEK
jgi:hypothetical protein